MSEVPQATAPALAPLTTRRRGGWFAMIIVGSLITLIAAAQLAGALALAGVVTVGAFSGQEGFVTSPPARVSAQASAVTTPPFVIEALGDRQSFPEIRVSLSAGREGDEPVFIGIGPSSDVEAYLDGVDVAELTGMRDRPLELQTREVRGDQQPLPPDEQSFWVASDSGPGARSLDWLVEPGRYTVVIMNADGSAGIDTTVRVGIEAPWAAPLAAVLIAVSIVALLVGIAVTLVGVLGWGRGRVPATPTIVGAYPVALSGELAPVLSRGLWLVKWLLAIPHWIVLSVLWVAFVLATIAAGIAILFTGRYPRPLFEFTVGVLRWSWRVSFYAYSALGTDRYPPFTLERADYPAELEIAYPERLSHGLVLVKSWLLAIPHLLVIGVVTGSTAWGVGSTMGVFGSTASSTSLLGLLVVIAAVILLFSGRYQRPLFDLIMGINRWAFRVAAYVALMRDEYPPFRLDQGALESAVAPAGPSTAADI